MSKFELIMTIAVVTLASNGLVFFLFISPKLDLLANLVFNLSGYVTTLVNIISEDDGIECNCPACTEYREKHPEETQG